MSHRLHLNENNFIQHNHTATSLYNESQVAHRYSGKMCDKSADLIAQYYNISRSNVIVFNGLDEAIFYATLYIKLFRKGAIVTTEKTYKTINVSASAIEQPIIEVSLSDNKIDLDILCNEIDNYIQNVGPISLCYICNPHNPTGSIMCGKLSRLLDMARKCNFLVFLDEAYIEFLGEERFNLEEKLSYENLIMGRTFSKAYGLAGLRCGYVLTKNESFLEWMNKVNDALLYKENRLSVAGIKSVLFEDSPLKQTNKRISNNRKKLEQILDKFGIRYLKSNTNFILAKPPCESDVFIDYARNKYDILLFNAIEFGWDGYFRITIGTDESVSLIEAMLSQMKMEGILS